MIGVGSGFGWEVVLCLVVCGYWMIVGVCGVG